jgi:hypothetical protein
MVSAALLLVAGSITLDSAKTEIEHDSAEREMIATNSELRTVSAQTRVGETRDLPLDDGVVSDVTVEENAARVSIEAVNGTGGTIDGATFDIGSASYKEDSTRITSEAGGVWRTGETGTTMVSSPSLTLTNGSVHFEVVDVKKGPEGRAATATKSDVTQFSPSLDEISDRPPVDVVLVSDESGSMDETDPNDLRLQATDQFIDDMAGAGKNDRVATVHNSLWGSHLGADCSGSGAFSPFDTDARVVNDLSDPQRVSASNQPDRCGTNYHAGLQQALDILEAQSSEDRKQVIVLMGDGEHKAIEQYGRAVNQYEYDERPTASNTRRLSREAQRRGVTIHTIGFGDGLNAPGERLLQDVTTDQGTYRFAEDPEDLEPVFESVFEEVTKEQPPERIRIEIESEFADAWEEYLREEFGNAQRVGESRVATSVEVSDDVGSDAISITVSEVRLAE